MRLHRGAVRKGLKEALSPGGRSVWSSRLVEEILGERLKAVRERTMREPWGWSPGLGRGRTVAPRRGFREKAKGQETSELHGDLTGGGVSLAVRQGSVGLREYLMVHLGFPHIHHPRGVQIGGSTHREMQTPEGWDPFKGISFQILESYRFSLQL